MRKSDDARCCFIHRDGGVTGDDGLKPVRLWIVSNRDGLVQYFHRGRSVQMTSSGSALILTGMLLQPTPRLTMSGPLSGISNRPRAWVRDSGPPALMIGVPSRSAIWPP